MFKVKVLDIILQIWAEKSKIRYGNYIVNVSTCCYRFPLEAEVKYTVLGFPPLVYFTYADLAQTIGQEDYTLCIISSFCPALSLKR
jgi:hypothetical protein